jgi:phage tail sheath protein FI
MPAPFFTTNDSDFSQLEGVYIKETNPPATVVEQSLNTVGVFGVTLKGPTDHPVFIDGEQAFVDVFGGGYLSGVQTNLVWRSLLNKGFSSLWVQRVFAAAAATASYNAESAAGGAGTEVLHIAAANPGLWGNQLAFKIVAATSGVANAFNLLIRDSITGKIWTFENIDIVTSAGDNTATVVGTADATPIRLTKLASTRPVNSAASTDGADTDGYIQLGATNAGYTSVAGTDGSVADSDYHGSGLGLDALANLKGPAIIYCAEYTSANLKAATKVFALASSDRMFLIGAADQTTSVSSAVSDVATYRSDRLVYCYNHAYTIDPVADAEVLVRPESWMATVLANTDVDIHPGEEDTKRFLAGITRIYQPSLTRADYISLRAAGISAMEIDLGSPVFVSGVVTDLTSGKTEITRRRMADFLQLSVAFALRFSVKKKITDQRKAAMGGMLKGFLGGLERQGRVVEAFNVDMDILNNSTDLANGIFRILMQVQLLPHMLAVVLTTEIGTGVTITTN